ncbi:MAG: FAD-dependent oxidoreductase [Hyphomonadaceae bacterium]
MAAGAETEPDYQRLAFRYEGAAQDDGRHPVIVIGAGPVGLATAIDLAQQGLPVLLLDDDDKLSQGSRHLLRQADARDLRPARLRPAHGRQGRDLEQRQGLLPGGGCLRFDLLPEGGHRRPAFINLQQYYVEGFLLDRAQSLPGIDIRWKHRVTGLRQDGDGITIEVETPDGSHRLSCDWLIAADGARSAMRKALGLVGGGQTLRDRFLIADVRMEADFPAERWFWFDPPFIRISRCCCIGSRTRFGASIFNSDGMRIPIAEQKLQIIPRVRRSWRGVV